MRRLEAKLEAALKEKSDLEQRFGALLAISDASVTRMHSPPVDAVSKRTRTPLVGQARSKGESPKYDVADGATKGGRSCSAAMAVAGDARRVDFSPGELRKSTLVGGKSVNQSIAARGDLNDVVNDTQRYEQGQAAVRDNAEPSRLVDKSADLTEAPTPPYGDAGGSGVDGAGGLDRKAFSRPGPASRLQQLTIALPPPPQLATPPSTPTRSADLLGSNCKRGRGAEVTSVVERLADFRDTSHDLRRGDDARRGKTSVVLPSPPAVDYVAVARRGELLDQQQDTAGIPAASQESTTLAADVGIVLFDSDKTNRSSGRLGGAGEESVTEKLRNIHSTFAALRAQTQAAS